VKIKHLTRPGSLATLPPKRPAAAPALQRADRQALQAIAIMAVCSMTFMPELAHAAPWDSAAQSVLDIFTGGLSRTIAIISVIACGIAALMGKLQWGWAINIVLGIVLIFGGATIVDYVIAASA
jgi:type IV secretion system protein VirB2